MIGRPSGKAALLGGAVALVLLVLGIALFVIDSPAERRRAKTDAQRIDDLHEISEAIDLYWTKEGSLPPDLETLDDWEGVDPRLEDPVTGERYEYRIQGKTLYELCAVFATSTADRDRQDAFFFRSYRFWHHAAGQHCFELEPEEVER